MPLLAPLYFEKLNGLKTLSDAMTKILDPAHAVTPVNVSQDLAVLRFSNTILARALKYFRHDIQKNI